MPRKNRNKPQKQDEPHTTTRFLCIRQILCSHIPGNCWLNSILLSVLTLLVLLFILVLFLLLMFLLLFSDKFFHETNSVPQRMYNYGAMMMRRRRQLPSSHIAENYCCCSQRRCRQGSSLSPFFVLLQDISFPPKCTSARIWLPFHEKKNIRQNCISPMWLRGRDINWRFDNSWQLLQCRQILVREYDFHKILVF